MTRLLHRLAHALGWYPALFRHALGPDGHLWAGTVCVTCWEWRPLMHSYGCPCRKGDA